MADNRLEQEFNAYSGWRARLYEAIVVFGDWIKDQKLSDLQSEQRLEQVLSVIQDDKLHVAFVAEFSRGKSELINATFFGQLGQRILPSSAGRTTMCPTELKYDHVHEPCIWLLPIETRSSGTTIAEYKNSLDEWESLALSVNNPEKLADTLAAVTEIKHVTVEHAHSLGLPVSDEMHEDGMPVREDGLVEIPRWRHAMINFPHPLLEQGLVILDTPGLNALGSEPELTLSMLASAHAVIFILAADSGVTKSDMEVWREHIDTRQSSPDGSRGPNKGRIAVLNKIDVLWDELRDKSEVDLEIDRQILATSKTLGLSESAIFPLSAQKALLGKIKGDQDLIQHSGIASFEEALVQMLIPAKLEIVRETIRNESDEIVKTINSMVSQRLKDVNEHIAELERLNSQNLDVVEDMMQKVSVDKDHLEKNLQRFQATRAIFSQQTNRLFEYLSAVHLDRMIAETKKDMQISLTTAGLRSCMRQFFQETTKKLELSAKQAAEIQELMEGVYKKFQEEHGLANITPRRYSISKHLRELKRLEERHDYFLRGISMVMTEQKVLTRKFYESVVSKVKQVFDRATRDTDKWLKTIMSPMESQVREHQAQLRRRLESIKRIHKASDTLEDRLAELQHVQEGMSGQDVKINAMIDEIFQCLDSDVDASVDINFENIA